MDDSSKQAPVTIFINDNYFKTTQITSGDYNDTYENRLTYTVRYSLLNASGKYLLRDQKISIHKDYVKPAGLTNSNDAQAKELERESIQEAITQLLNRLNSRHVRRVLESAGMHASAPPPKAARPARH